MGISAIALRDRLCSRGRSSAFALLSAHRSLCCAIAVVFHVYKESSEEREKEREADEEIQTAFLG